MGLHAAAGNMGAGARGAQGQQGVVAVSSLLSPLAHGAAATLRKGGRPGAAGTTGTGSDDIEEGCYYEDDFEPADASDASDVTPLAHTGRAATSATTAASRLGMSADEYAAEVALLVEERRQVIEMLTALRRRMDDVGLSPDYASAASAARAEPTSSGDGGGGDGGLVGSTLSLQPDQYLLLYKYEYTSGRLAEIDQGLRHLQAAGH